jgi:hypothetical protein
VINDVESVCVWEERNGVVCEVFVSAHPQSLPDSASATQQLPFLKTMKETRMANTRNPPQPPARPPTTRAGIQRETQTAHRHGPEACGNECVFTCSHLASVCTQAGCEKCAAAGNHSGVRGWDDRGHTNPDKVAWGLDHRSCSSARHRDVKESVWSHFCGSHPINIRLRLPHSALHIKRVCLPSRGVLMVRR